MSRSTLSKVLASRRLPHRFLASQLRRPTGRFGRWVMARALNDGNAELIDAALDALELGGSDRLLDVGFGGGRALREAARRTEGALFGVDFSPDMVLAGHRALRDLCAAGRLSLLTADVASLPLRDGVVDAVVTTNTIYFWPDLPAALAELHRVLAPGGRVAFGYTGREKMERFEAVTQHGFTTFRPEDLEGPLGEAGFSEVRTIALDGAVTEGDFVTVARPGEG